MSKQYDYIEYTGRFEPFHVGHLETVKKSFSHTKNLIMVLGSANIAPTPKNPWSVDQRKEMIISSTKGLGNIIFVPVEDRLYNRNKWISYVQSAVDDIAGEGSVALIGHDKDESIERISDNFPMWDFIDTGPYVKEKGKGKIVSATKIRELLFEGHLGYIESNVPKEVYKFLEDYTNTYEFTAQQAEYIHIINDEKVVDTLEHGQNFITSDSVVVQSGHILLVKRATYPGKGLWSCPGVHVDQNETPDEASIRALVGEANLKVPVKVLKGSLKEMKVFAHPDRSLRARLTQTRARTLTLAYYYELDSSKPLPTNVRGGEGIEKAWWFSFPEVRKMRSQLFEDHADIIDYFIG